MFNALVQSLMFRRNFTTHYERKCLSKTFSLPLKHIFVDTVGILTKKIFYRSTSHPTAGPIPMLREGSTVGN